jgi:hypothetical protein
LSDGDCAAAADHLVRGCRIAETIGIGHPGIIPLVSDGTIALACAGRIEEATQLLGLLAKQTAAADTARMSALLEHAAGVVALALGDTDRAALTLSSAVTCFEQLGLRPDAARANLALGRSLIRAGKRTAATRSLNSARDLFEAMAPPAGQLKRPPSSTASATPTAHSHPRSPRSPHSSRRA